jgi:cytochrome c55X
MEVQMRRSVALAAAGLMTAAVAAAEVGDDRKTELVQMLDDSCSSCHGPGMAGGMAGPLTPAALAGKDVADLAEVILHGRPGTMMPGFAANMTAEEAAWLAQRLQNGPGAP